MSDHPNFPHGHIMMRIVDGSRPVIVAILSKNVSGYFVQELGTNTLSGAYHKDLCKLDFNRFQKAYHEYLIHKAKEGLEYHQEALADLNKELLEGGEG